jgi:Carboxypeptidase regulatory-like domain
MYVRGRIGFGVLAALLLAVSSEAQQTSGSIRGVVTDPSGALVAGVQVTVRQTETGLTRSAVSDAYGVYVVIELPIGIYRLEATVPGFQTYAQEGIELNVNATPDVPVRLVLGTPEQRVEVLAGAAMIESTVSTLGQTVFGGEILSLPLNGRDFSQLGTLQPGVVPLTPGLAEAGGSLRDGQAYAVNGQRPESNHFLIDGASNFDTVDGGFVLKPPVDAIAEFRILTLNADAEFGHSAGSTTNIVTRSGSNELHGSLWEFLRNDALDARNFFASETEPLRRNQFGAALGGPIRRDETFLFGYYEGVRNREGITRRSTVPSLLERQGDFSAMCQTGFDANGFCQDADPSHQLFNVFANAPVPYNQLPGIHPLSQGLIDLFPEPNSGTNFFVSTETLGEDSDQFGIRLDHYLTPDDSLNVRYSLSDGTRTNPLPPSGASVPGFPVGEEHRAQNLVVQETRIFGPGTVGVFRFSFLRNKFLFGLRSGETTPQDLGFQYSSSLAIATGAPFIQVNGYTTVGDPITGPRNTDQNSFDYSAALTWISGRHELKFGGGYQHERIDILQGIATNGFFVFDAFPITNAFASFLAGQPVFFLQGRGEFPRDIRGRSLNAYLQDKLRVRDGLTLNLGVRYELPFPYVEAEDRQSLWIPGRQSQVVPGAPGGLLYPGDPGVPRGLIQTFSKAFSPRIGVAWDPLGDGDWLVTSGYGVFYDPYYTGQGGPLQTPISAPPYLQTAQVGLPNFADPFNGTPPGPNQFVTPMTNLTLSPDLSLPYAQNWHLNVERSLTDDLLFEVGYIGTRGTHLPRFVEGNPAVYVPGQSTPDNADQRRLYSGCTLADSPADCIYSSTGLIAGVSSSTYHALESSLRMRELHGVSFLASYTLSKALDDVSSFNMTGSAAMPVAGENDLAQDPFDLSAEWGRSLFDVRQRFVLSYEWDLPFWTAPETWYQHALGDWHLSGIATVMSGAPFTVFDSRDIAAKGGAPEITGFSSQRPDRVPGEDPNAGPRQVDNWLNAAAFAPLDATADAGRFGTAGRNTVDGPGYFNWDFAAYKNLSVTEATSLQIRAEFFNILNHVNFRLPDSDVSSPTYNQIRAALPPRLIQFGLKLVF